jgi:ribosomal protein S18 acetylase RimI-like enzyme
LEAVIEVRDATIDDADAIATVHIDGWRGGYRGIVPDEYLDSEEFATSRRDRWREWAWQSTVGSRLFVVTIHDRLVGFGYAGPERLGHDAASTARARGEVYAFYLHPTAWGSGGAGALMSRCEEFLRDEGYESAVLWVLRDNPRARAFYEKAGWCVTGEESNFALADSPATNVPEVQYDVRL